MFSNQNWRVKLACAGFGCLFGSFCTIMGMLASPVTAQRDKFGDIECSSLTVVDASTGHQEIILGGSFGGIECMSLAVVDAKGTPEILLAGGVVGGGVVRVADKGGKVKVRLSIGENGGVVSVLGKDGRPAAELGATEHGGRVRVSGKSEGQAVMAINEYGNGAVSTWDKNGYRQ